MSMSELQLEFMIKHQLRMNIRLDPKCRFPVLVNLYYGKGKIITVEDFTIGEAMAEAFFRFEKLGGDA